MDWYFIAKIFLQIFLLVAIIGLSIVSWDRFHDRWFHKEDLFDKQFKSSDVTPSNGKQW